jgi:predicted nucleotidyltransferase
MTKLIEERWLAEIRRIVAEQLAEYSVDVYLFGSRARGDHQVASDVDLAIDPHGTLPPSAISRLRDALEESRVPLWVDVVDLRTASATMVERVRREGTKWIASKSA